MFEFHADTQVYYNYQTENANKYVIPFIERTFPLREGMRVLEIGCGEGGVLRAFLQRGCAGMGVELAAGRARNANEFLKEYAPDGQPLVIAKNIYDVNDVETELGGAFDLIVMKDVIEHIPDQARLLAWLQKFLRPNGCIYFGFPPWQMPFGGHQQICKNKWLSKLPYYHLLPVFLYRWLLRMGGESPEMVKELLEIKETGISIERFERIARDTRYQVQDETHYFINPIYEYKFKLKPRIQSGLIRRIPFLRNFLTTCVFYLITPKRP